MTTFEQEIELAFAEVFQDRSLEQLVTNWAEKCLPPECQGEELKKVITRAVRAHNIAYGEPSGERSRRMQYGLVLCIRALTHWRTNRN